MKVLLAILITAFGWSAFAGPEDCVNYYLQSPVKVENKLVPDYICIKSMGFTRNFNCIYVNTNNYGTIF